MSSTKHFKILVCLHWDSCEAGDIFRSCETFQKTYSLLSISVAMSDLKSEQGCKENECDAEEATEVIVDDECPNSSEPTEKVNEKDDETTFTACYLIMKLTVQDLLSATCNSDLQFFLKILPPLSDENYSSYRISKETRDVGPPPVPEWFEGLVGEFYHLLFQP